MPNKVFVDTSGWANLFVATESYHEQAKQWFQQARRQGENMVTTNYVVIELVALLNSPLRVPRPQLFKYVDAVITEEAEGQGAGSRGSNPCPEAVERSGTWV